jgi:hypothetical protein
MVFPIVAPPNPWGLWFVQIWISTISGSSCVDLSFSGFVFLQKILKWPHSVFAFCNYLHFEEDLALDLYNSKFPLPKGDLYLVWLKLACWFWKEDFFQNKHSHLKMFSSLWSHPTPGDYDLYKLEFPLF